MVSRHGRLCRAGKLVGFGKDRAVPNRWVTNDPWDLCMVDQRAELLTFASIFRAFSGLQSADSWSMNQCRSRYQVTHTELPVKRLENLENRSCQCRKCRQNHKKNWNSDLRWQNNSCNFNKLPWHLLKFRDVKQQLKFTVCLQWLKVIQGPRTQEPVRTGPHKLKAVTWRDRLETGNSFAGDGRSQDILQRFKMIQRSNMIQQYHQSESISTIGISAAWKTQRAFYAFDSWCAKCQNKKKNTSNSQRIQSLWAPGFDAWDCLPSTMALAQGISA